MADEAVKFGWMQRLGPQAPDKKIYGVTVCTVVNNIDCNGQARVQLSLPWLPGFQPWARISNQSGGKNSGSYFVPQVGDEVLVSFNHGDVREPYIVGALWNTQDRPPAPSPTDAVTKRKIRTPQGHELEFDDLLQKVTLTTSGKTSITLDLQKAEISTPAATVTLGVSGEVSVTGKTKITLDAPVIEINGKVSVKIEGKTVALKGAALCEVRGKPVNINC
jgi:phage baseplate assembly protein V